MLNKIIAYESGEMDETDTMNTESEASLILRQWHEGKNREQAAGQQPTVAILGTTTYHALHGTIDAVYSPLTKMITHEKPAIIGLFVFQGITVCESRSIDEGMFFGSFKAQP